MSNHSNFCVRQLAANDIGVVRELLGVFGAAFEDLETYTARQPRDEYLDKLLRGDHFIMLAALHENSVIGGLAAYELVKFERERSEIYIYDLAVAEAFRRKGVASALIEYLKPVAAARDADVIFVQADHTDPPAIALYTKLGTREDVLHFDIDAN